MRATGSGRMLPVGWLQSLNRLAEEFRRAIGGWAKSLRNRDPENTWFLGLTHGQHTAAARGTPWSLFDTFFKTI